MLKIYYEDNHTGGEITVSINGKFMFRRYGHELDADDLRKIFIALNIKHKITKGKYP